MANFNDSQIAEQIVILPTPERLPYLLRVKDNIIDDSTYWQLVAGVWLDSEVCSPYLSIWRELFTAKRRNRHKLMKKHDRKIWRALPDVMVAYRAVNPDEDVDTAISWTLDHDVAIKLARGRTIVSKTLHKKNVLAYFDRRKEQEIIYLNEAQYEE